MKDSKENLKHLVCRDGPRRIICVIYERLFKSEWLVWDLIDCETFESKTRFISVGDVYIKKETVSKNRSPPKPNKFKLDKKQSKINKSLPLNSN